MHPWLLIGSSFCVSVYVCVCCLLVGVELTNRQSDNKGSLEDKDHLQLGVKWPGVFNILRQQVWSSPIIF